MAEVYWYISKSKVQQLNDAAPEFLAGVSAELKFKFPFLEGGIAGTNSSPNVIRQLKRVVARLEREGGIVSFDQIGDDAPTVIRFDGIAGRLIDKKGLWLAMRKGDTALLLVGSAEYATGRAATDPDPISFSADPVGAIWALYKGKDERRPKNLRSLILTDFDITEPRLVSSLQYAWLHVFKQTMAKGPLPSVEGLAIFARGVDLDADSMRPLQTLGIPVTRVIVGSPIFVRQQ